MEGFVLGLEVGDTDGFVVGDFDGDGDGAEVGECDGFADGDFVGEAVGGGLGFVVGCIVGKAVRVGAALGSSAHWPHVRRQLSATPPTAHLTTALFAVQEHCFHFVTSST